VGNYVFPLPIPVTVHSKLPHSIVPIEHWICGLESCSVQGCV